MATRDHGQWWGGFWINSLATLASRLLGLVRDIATAALLGLGEGGVMDALVIAFRVPNLLRRIFGEGALAAAFLPVFSGEYERAPTRAWQLLSALFLWLAVLLIGVALVGEAVCAAILWSGAGGEATEQLVGLIAAMLPYLVLICLAAQASAALQARFEFRWPAIAPVLLNVCWLAAVWWVAPRFAPDKLAQAHVIAVAVLISGVLQLGVQIPALRRLGFRFAYDWPVSRAAFWNVVVGMLPITLGMAVTQLNTMMDSLVAWSLSAEGDHSRSIAWLGHAVDYPMRSGAAAAIYYGERFYQFPVGILGVAIATVIYPLLSRHAARGDHASVASDLALGLRLVWFTALPAGVGIVLVAQPLTRLLFERGEFSADDAARAARMIACYATGVWAYCAIPLLVRGFYAVGDRVTPARLGIRVVGINFLLNITLIWPLAERGLAVSTSIAAALQVVLLLFTFSRRVSVLAWRELASTLARSVLAVLVMSLVVMGTEHFLPIEGGDARPRQWLLLSIQVLGGAAAYLLASWLLGMRELALLIRRPRAPRD